MRLTFGKIPANGRHRCSAAVCVPRVLLCSIMLHACAACADVTPARVTEIAPGVYLHQGVTVPFSDPQRGDIANNGFIVGDQCVAVIDTGGSLQTGALLRNAIGRVTHLPVCYVINTHVHFDHVLGNKSFAGDRPEFLGHAGLVEAMAASRAFFLKDFSAELGGNPTAEFVIGPSRTVATALSLDLGNRKILLNAWPVAHTHADLTVFDEQTRTLWTGDLVFREHIPVLDGNLKGWLAVLKDLGDIPAQVIIPGHGPPGSGWTEVASAQENYLNELLQQTRQALADGVFMEDAINTVGAGNAGQWLLHEQHHRGNVSRAYVELEWE